MRKLHYIEPLLVPMSVDGVTNIQSMLGLRNGTLISMPRQAIPKAYHIVWKFLTVRGWDEFLFN